jgi:hypothetical protein
MNSCWKPSWTAVIRSMSILKHITTIIPFLAAVTKSNHDVKPTFGQVGSHRNIQVLHNPVPTPQKCEDNCVTLEHWERRENNCRGTECWQMKTTRQNCEGSSYA